MATFATRTRGMVDYNAHSSASFGGDKLDTTIAEAVRLALWYHSMSYVNVRFTIETHCAHCDGLGAVRKPRTMYDTKPCPKCKGNPIVQSIGPIPAATLVLGNHFTVQPCEQYA